jgi:hypothetical protein
MTEPAAQSTDEAADLRAEVEAIHALRRECDRIMAAHPDLDRHTVWHTLLCLRLTPEERVQRSLMRGRGLLAFRKKLKLESEIRP